MNKIIPLYKITSIVDAILTTFALCCYIYYRTNENVSGYFFITFFYLSFLISLFIGNKLIKSIYDKIKTTEEYIIVGSISTIIKVLITIALIVGSFFFVTITNLSNFFSYNADNLPYYIIAAAFFVWNLFSFFNSIAYFLIVSMHKNIRLPQIDDLSNDDFF